MILKSFFIPGWLCLCLAGVAHAQDNNPISAAEQLIFNQPHLAALKPPQQLRYSFREQAGAGAPVDDAVTLSLTRSAGGHCCAASARYLSGPRALALPDLPEASANPVLLYFLEQQIRQLQQATGGQSAHFRRRIRLALAANPAVESVKWPWNGAEVAASRVTVSPYADDPQRHRFEARARTSYTFILSEQVPGMVLELAADLADGDKTTRQTLTLLPSTAATQPKR